MLLWFKLNFKVFFFCSYVVLLLEDSILFSKQTAELSLLVFLPSYLGHETTKCPLRSSSQAATWYYQSNHSKIEAIPLNALPKDATSELSGLSSHQPY